MNELHIEGSLASRGGHYPAKGSSHQIQASARRNIQHICYRHLISNAKCWWLMSSCFQTHHYSRDNYKDSMLLQALCCCSRLDSLGGILKRSKFLQKGHFFLFYFLKEANFPAPRYTCYRVAFLKVIGQSFLIRSLITAINYFLWSPTSLGSENRHANLHVGSKTDYWARWSYIFKPIIRYMTRMIW